MQSHNVDTSRDSPWHWRAVVPAKWQWLPDEMVGVAVFGNPASFLKVRRNGRSPARPVAGIEPALCWRAAAGVVDLSESIQAVESR